MSGQGSTSNVIAAVCSFFVPGLGTVEAGYAVVDIVRAPRSRLLFIAALVAVGSCADKDVPPP